MKKKDTESSNTEHKKSKKSKLQPADNAHVITKPFKMRCKEFLPQRSQLAIQVIKNFIKEFKQRFSENREK